RHAGVRSAVAGRLIADRVMTPRAGFELHVSEVLNCDFHKSFHHQRCNRPPKVICHLLFRICISPGGSAIQRRFSICELLWYFYSPSLFGRRTRCRSGKPSAWPSARTRALPAPPPERELPRPESHKPTPACSPRSTTPSPSRAATTRSSFSVRCSPNTSLALRPSPSAP